MNKEAEKLLLAILDETVEHKELAGINLLVRKENKEICYLQSGYADLEEKKPLQRDSIFRLYSMTKPVTAVAAMILIEQGKIDLGEAVSKFFPCYQHQKVILQDATVKPLNREVTIHDLLSMTSGMMYPGFPGEAGNCTDKVFQELEERLFSENPMTTRELAVKLGEQPLAFQPGTSWLYSTGADILGAIIEQVTEMSFSEFLHKYLFEPLNMRDTGFYVPEKERHRLVKAYQREEEKLVPYEGCNLSINNRMDTPPAFESGGAGLASTIDDYSYFAQMLLNKGTFGGHRILKERTVEFLTQADLLPCQQVVFEEKFPHLAGYSYGNFMRVLKKEGACYAFGNQGEYGWDGWLGCYYINDPAANLTILSLTQQKDAGYHPAARKLKNIILSNL